MQGYDVCSGTPEALVKSTVCLDEVSKDARGDLTLLESDVEECRRLDCRTLTSEHVLRLELSSHDCDSDVGRLFDGRLVSKDLTTVFVDGSGERRGTHLGTFVWRSSAGDLTGDLRGMTNEGTHREPAFDGCQRCAERGVMEGRQIHAWRVPKSWAPIGSGSIRRSAAARERCRARWRVWSCAAAPRTSTVSSSQPSVATRIRAPSVR
jgi:hypothetical protein